MRIKKQLVIRIFRGSFKAVSFVGSEVDSVYETDKPIESMQEIDDAISEAIKQSGYRGKYVSFIYEGPFIEHTFLNTQVFGNKTLSRSNGSLIRL